MTAKADANLAAVVETTQGSYRVVVGQGIVESLPEEFEKAGISGRAFLIADEALFPVAVRRVQETLEAAGVVTHVMTLHAGEQAKNLETLSYVYDWLADLRGERGDTLISLGGGVMGDLVGFAAATWLRGVAFVQIPTTLAAMVDASLGGKTAINLPTGKNLVGAFHQPRLVLSDLDLLATLPERELRSGWAEAIKHGLILDNQLLEDIEANSDSLISLEGEKTAEIIRRSVAIKADVVSADEFERGETRILLNYGHTIGHAIEASTSYGTFLHGEAVAIGMMAAGRISVELGLISEEILKRQHATLTRFGLPTLAPGLDTTELIERTKSDKKSRGGAVQWVLLDGPGHATIRRDVPEQLVRSIVDDLIGA
ncbi:MAG: 3-dehydroquinate synthase [Chloroflexi bacterium]|nr:3-dehydroquinate synthase [Chloroflexota bacterium]